MIELCKTLETKWPKLRIKRIKIAVQFSWTCHFFYEIRGCESSLLMTIKICCWSLFGAIIKIEKVF